MASQDGAGISKLRMQGSKDPVNRDVCLIQGQAWFTSGAAR
jgi:hypothetical protein